MIVGVDESGDFRVGSRAFFAAIFIRPSERDRVARAHKAWEREARRELGAANELKGHQVSDSLARDFCNTVFYNANGTSVGYLAYAVDNTQASEAAMELQRDIFASGYDSWAKQMRSSGVVQKSQGAGGMSQQAHWIRGLGSIPFLKLMTLGSILPELFEWSLGRSIADGFDEELSELRVLIDRGYVKQDNVAAWQDVLRNIFIGSTQDRPVPFASDWTDDHPFMRTFVDKQRGEGVILKPAFKDAIEFCDSMSTPEIRIADVVVSLVRRVELDGEDLPSYGRLREFSFEPRRFKLLEWTPDRRPPQPNPYLGPA